MNASHRISSYLTSAGLSHMTGNIPASGGDLSNESEYSGSSSDRPITPLSVYTVRSYILPLLLLVVDR